MVGGFWKTKMTVAIKKPSRITIPQPLLTTPKTNAKPNLGVSPLLRAALRRFPLPSSVNAAKPTEVVAVSNDALASQENDFQHWRMHLGI